MQKVYDWTRPPLGWAAYSDLFRSIQIYSDLNRSGKPRGVDGVAAWTRPPRPPPWRQFTVYSLDSRSGKSLGFGVPLPPPGKSLQFTIWILGLEKVYS